MSARAWNNLVKAVSSYLVMDEYVSLRIVVSSYLANLLESPPPVWLIINGRPGGGKTEYLRLFETCERSYDVSSFTKASFISGYNREESILVDQNNGKILLVKDMSTMISGNNESLAEIMAILRYVYDGEYKKSCGKGIEVWKGKLGFIGGVTPEIENRREFLTSLGERFMYLKLNDSSEDYSRRVMRKSMQGDAVRGGDREVAQKIVLDLVQSWNGLTASKMTKALPVLIENASLAMAKTRAVVPRDRFRREVTGEPIIEVPTRISQQTLRVCLCARELGASFDEIMTIPLRFLNDSIATDRHKVLSLIIKKIATTTTEIAKAMGYSKPYASRVLEDLQILNIITSQRGGYAITDHILGEAVISNAK